MVVGTDTVVEYNGRVYDDSAWNEAIVGAELLEDEGDVEQESNRCHGSSSPRA
jgi:hypothetical protein